MWRTSLKTEILVTRDGDVACVRGPAAPDVIKEGLMGIVWVMNTACRKHRTDCIEDSISIANLLST